MKIFPFLFLFTLLADAYAQKAVDPKPRVQEVLNAYQSSVTDFGIVALVDNGRFKDTASLGLAFAGQRISTSNRFCIGSCTKMFTAVLILKLQEEGLLNLNDSISRYIPSHPYIDGAITIRQLLNHTSGLTDILKNGFMNAPLLEPFGDYSDPVLYAKIDTIDFAKGTRYKYCNTNYFLLSEIVERVTDRSFETNLQEKIIGPLALKNTFAYHSNSIERLAHPIIDGQDLHAIPKMANSILSKGSGNIVSDVFDLNTFIRALLLDKTLLRPESLAAMRTFYAYKNTQSGLGLSEERYSGRVFLGHSGRQISYIAYAFVDPQTGESIVVLNNNANDETIDKVFEQLCSQR